MHIYENRKGLVLDFEGDELRSKHDHVVKVTNVNNHPVTIKNGNFVGLPATKGDYVKFVAYYIAAVVVNRELYKQSKKFWRVKKWLQRSK